MREESAERPFREAARHAAQVESVTRGDVVRIGALVGSLVAASSVAIALGRPLADAGSVTVAPWVELMNARAVGPAAFEAVQVGAIRLVGAGVAAAVLLAGVAVLIALVLLRREADAPVRTVHRAVGAHARTLLGRELGRTRPALLTLPFGVLLLSFAVPRLLSQAATEGWIQASVGTVLLMTTVTAVVVLHVLSRPGSRSLHTDRRGLSPLFASPVLVAGFGFAGFATMGSAVTHAAPESLVPDARDLWFTEATVGAEADLPVGAFGVASAGAARGLGHDIRVTVNCGNCFMGGMPLPIRTARAELHAVAPDTFPYLGLSVIEGRDFASEDRGDAPSVAIVSQSFAHAHFEGGKAIGRELRLGEGDWIPVVGVVEDRPDTRDHTQFAIWVAVAEAGLREFEVFGIGGIEDGVASTARAAQAGVSFGPFRPMTDLFPGARFFRTLGLGLGLLSALVLVLGLGHALKLDDAGTRTQLAVAHALGASRRRLLVDTTRRALLESLGSIALGGWLTLPMIAAMETAFGRVPVVSPQAWLLAAAPVALLFFTARLSEWRMVTSAPPTDGLRKVGR